MARKKHVEEEEHENHERWMVTYADMITLLMVLFIVLFAMSSVDQKKFNALKSGLAAGFGQSTSVLDGSSSILDEPGTAVAQPINPNRVAENPEITEIKVQAVSAAQREKNQKMYAEAAAEADRLLRIEKRLMAALRAKGLEGDVRSDIDGRGLTVSLVSKHVVFEANQATLTSRGQSIVDALAPVLKEITDRLQIEGHTNQAAGKPKFYASDWDLSSARAVTVLRHLNELREVPADRLAAVGFGHVKPLVDPSVPGSQKLNKRVDIVVMSSLAEENSELLDRVMYDRAKEGATTGKDAL
jgi:chemotaxis protein MotB